MITVPTLALALPFMVVWVAGYYVVASHEWSRQVDAMVFGDDALTPWRFARGLMVAVFCGFFWPVALVVGAVAGRPA